MQVILMTLDTPSDLSGEYYTRVQLINMNIGNYTADNFPALLNVDRSDGYQP